MNKLNTYLEGRTARELARAAGISEAFLCELRRGSRMPSFATMRKIHDATNGEVSYADWADGVQIGGDA